MTLIIDMASGDTLESDTVQYDMRSPAHDRQEGRAVEPSDNVALQLVMVAPGTTPVEPVMPQALLSADIDQFLDDID